MTKCEKIHRRVEEFRKDSIFCDCNLDYECNWLRNYYRSKFLTNEELIEINNMFN